MKNYEVTRIDSKGIHEYGSLAESDVKRMLKGYEYDELFGMWFSPKANVSYTVEEIKG